MKLMRRWEETGEIIMDEYITKEQAKVAFDGSIRMSAKDWNMIFDGIDAIPAADVRPVKRGHWITEEEAEKIGDYSKRDTCSVCGHCDWDCTESAYFNFCPNCGADMREYDHGI